MGIMNSICTPKSAGISVDLNMYEPHLVASTMTHMIGHNLYINHDYVGSKYIMEVTYHTIRKIQPKCQTHILWVVK